MPTTMKLAAFRLERDILDGMEALRTRDGIPASEQVRRALRAYLTTKGVRLAPPKRTTANKGAKRR